MSDHRGAGKRKHFAVVVIAAGVATALSVSGCGTTVQIAQAPGSGDTVGLTAPTSTSGTGVGAAQAPSVGSSVPVAGSVASAPGNATGQLPTGHTAAPTAAGVKASAASVPPSGRGWDRHTVYIGMTTAKDAETTLQALGISLNPGDEAGDAQAVEKAVNKAGGMFGRKVQIVIHDNHSADMEQNPAGVAQANCTYFTQDRPVVAVINTISTIDLDSFRACLARAHLPLVTLSTAPFDDTTERAYAPYYYNPVSVSWSQLASVFLSRLSQQRFFTGWNAATATASPSTRVKVGVVYGEDAAGTRAANALLIGLKQAGYATDSYQYGQDSEAPSAVVRFEQDGVTHVLSVDNFLFLFMTAAASQHYRPRYGVNTYNGIQALLESDVPASQLTGSEGVGWEPSLDVDRDQGPAGPGRQQCLAALAAGGQTYAGKRFAQAVGLAICDGIHLAVMGAETGGGLDPGAMRAGIVRLGANFPVAGGFSSGLSATNFGLPGSGRDVQYSSTCSCFTYTSSTYRV